MTDKFCLRWNDFEANISGALQELRDDKELETLRKEVIELRASQTIDQQFLSTLESDEIIKKRVRPILEDTH